MKKLLVFLFIILLLCCVNIVPHKELTLKNIFSNVMVEVYTSKQIKNEELSKISNGEGEIIFCDIVDLDYILQTYNCVSGFTLKFEKNDFSVNDIINKIDTRTCYNKNFGIYGLSYAISSLLNNKYVVEMEQTKCNFQIYETKSQIFLGIPLILGSY